jgi:hypothetical protein
MKIADEIGRSTLRPYNEYLAFLMWLYLNAELWVLYRLWQVRRVFFYRVCEPSSKMPVGWQPRPAALASPSSWRKYEV